MLATFLPDWWTGVTARHLAPSEILVSERASNVCVVEGRSVGQDMNLGAVDLHMQVPDKIRSITLNRAAHSTGLR